MQSPVFISNVRHAPLAASSVIGRTDELQKIADALKTGDNLLLINGMGGVGKTTLVGRVFRKLCQSITFESIDSGFKMNSSKY